MHYRLLATASVIGLAASLIPTAAEAQECHRGAYSTICAPAPPPPPSGPPPPSAADLIRQRDDANQQAALDDGLEAFRRGDFASAIRNFREALDYSPGDPEITQAIALAQQRLEERNRQPVVLAGPAVREADVARRSECVFDGRACPDNGQGIQVDSTPVAGRPVGDPVVPEGRMTPQIRELERQRTAQRQRIAAINAELNAPAASANPVRVAELRQQRSQAESQVSFVNLSINEALRARPPAPPAAPRRTRGQR